jgi:hypothetical protein
MISVCMAGVPLLWAFYAIAMLAAGVQLKLVICYIKGGGAPAQGWGSQSVRI